MRSERVFTNMTCSQNCTYCTSRATAEVRSFVTPAAVHARIDDALSKGATEIVLTGGEPTLRRDLGALIQYARSKGAGSVVIETNATGVEAETARKWALAGLSTARVNLAGPDARLDVITRDPGGFERAERGIVHLLNAGIPVEFLCVAVQSTLPFLAEIPAAIGRILQNGAITRAPTQPTTCWLSVPVQSPNVNELCRYEDVVSPLLAFEKAARAMGFPVKLVPSASPPPCVFPERGRPTHLFSLTAGGRKREEYTEFSACANCHVRDRCPGISREYLARFGPPDAHPVKDDRTRRRLSLISTVEEQVRRELVTPNRYRDSMERDLDEAIIRVNFHCNQSCRFCFVSTHLPEAGDIAVRTAIVEAAERGEKITLSGGEPTLNSSLVDYVRLAKTHSKLPVLLQTNAIKLDDEQLTNRLVEAGLDEAFISLHGTTAEISDKVTNAPGTFVRTVVGIDNLYRTGKVRIVLNFVICQSNASNLPEYVRFVARRWPKTFLNVSFVAPSTDVVPREEEFIPRYRDVIPFIEEGLHEARRLGIEMGGFESMCGIPLCLVPTSLDSYFRLTSIPPGFDKGEFVKTETCNACDLAAGCYGLRRGYYEMHGDNELKAVKRNGKSH
ncbi:MAG: radical SAM protein [Polyangiaceae bacterium]|nr:radical SAM protein [Polyangiaceae bacterium]